MYAGTDIIVRGGLHESVVAGLTADLLELGGVHRFDALYPPPVMPRKVLERSGYLANFPHLIGGLVAFDDSDERVGVQMSRSNTPGSTWHSLAAASDAYLTPAACYVAYADLQHQTIDATQTRAIVATCYRHEPSDDPMRLRSFRMQEFIAVGTPDDCARHADKWLQLAGDFLVGLGLDTDVEMATDPFFGRMGRLAASIQIEKEQKRERVWCGDGRSGTAIMSVNNHEEHFGSTFDIVLRDGRVAHSACAAFGLDRVATALFLTHGRDPALWPASVRHLVGTQDEVPV